MNTILWYILISLSIVLAAPRSKGLREDLSDIVKLVDKTKLKELLNDYIENDAEVRAVFDYLKENPEAVTVLKSIRYKPEVEELHSWIFGQMFKDALEHPFNHKQSHEKPTIEHWNDKRTGGWKGLIEDGMKIFPLNEYLKLVSEKVAEKGVFAELVERVKALKPVYQEFVKEPEVAKVISELNNVGFDSKITDHYLRIVLGWN